MGMTPDDRVTESDLLIGAGEDRVLTIPNLVTGTQKLAGAADYTANLGTDYVFRDGKLKGFSAGFGLHYRGKMVVGFRGADTIVSQGRSRKKKNASFLST